MISLCLATKRPKSFKKMCESALETATNSEDIEFVSYHDDDVPYEYVGNHKEVRGETKNLNQMINACQKKATGDIYMFTCDDFLFLSNDWDTYIHRTFDAYDDKIVFVAPDNTDWKRWGFGVVGFLHKNWIDTVGFMPEELGEATDRWINEVALMVGRRTKLDDVLVHHTNEQDEVHRNKKRVCKANRWNQRYIEFYEQRLEEAGKLRAYIEKHNHILHSQSRTCCV